MPKKVERDRMGMIIREEDAPEKMEVELNLLQLVQEMWHLRSILPHRLPGPQGRWLTLCGCSGKVHPLRNLRQALSGLRHNRRQRPLGEHHAEKNQNHKNSS